MTTIEIEFITHADVHHRIEYDIEGDERDRILDDFAKSNDYVKGNIGCVEALEANGFCCDEIREQMMQELVDEEHDAVERWLYLENHNSLFDYYDDL